jgi:hypothetical protein
MICLVPTLFAGSVVAAIAPPPRATSKATIATIIEGDSRFIGKRLLSRFEKARTAPTVQSFTL